MCDGAWRGVYQGGRCFSEEVGLKVKPFPRPFHGDHQLGVGVEGENCRGKERQALTQMQRFKVSKRVPAHEKLFSLYIKVSPPIDGIISISNITVIFA